MPKKTRAVGNFGSSASISIAADNTYVDLGLMRIYTFSTAITTGVTAVPSGAGLLDLAVTSHATGDEGLFKNVAGVWTKVA